MTDTMMIGTAKAGEENEVTTNLEENMSKVIKDMDRTVSLFVGIAYIVFWIGYSAGSVGLMPGPPEPFTWKLPITMAGLIIPPFIFGFLSGRK